MADGQWTLTIREQGKPPRTVAAIAGMTLGRHPSSACLIKDETVSGRHARVLDNAGTLVLQDLGSNNGTRIDRSILLSRNEAVALRDGMHVQVGRVEIDVRWLTGAVRAKAAPSRARSAAPPAAPTVERAAATVESGYGAPAQAAPAAARPAVSPMPAGPVPATPAADYAASYADGDEATSLPSAPEYGLEDATIRPGEGDLTTRTEIAQIRARLLILDPDERRRVPLDEPEVLVGRAPDARCRIENKGASMRHARIVYSSKSFLIEDLGSSNGTRVDRAEIPRGTKHELVSDCYVRFGPVEAVYLSELGPNLRPLASSRRSDAVALLVADGKLDAGARERAQTRADDEGIQLAEALLLSGAVTAKDWCWAVEEAPRRIPVKAASGSRAPSAKTIAIVVAAIIVLVLVAILLG